MSDTRRVPPYPRRAYGWYVVALLIVAYVLAFIDRGVLALLIQPIKADLGLTDVQMSWLMGPAFGIFYATLGLPIAVLADRRSRRNIVMVGVALWSLATAACGLARSFVQLFVARMLVGVGEATLSPCAYSMIPDFFPRRAALRAVGLYNIGQSVGAGIAFLLGGQVVMAVSGAAGVQWPLIGVLLPWQMTFIIVGLPGLALAALMLTISEPVRRGFLERGAGSARDPRPVSATMRYLRTHWKAFGAVFVGNSVVTTVGYAYFWLPSVFQRTWGVDPAHAGIYYGSVLATCGPLGIIAGSRLCEFLYQRGRADAPFVVFSFSLVGTLPFAIAMPLAPTPALAIALLVPTMTGFAAASASSSAAIVHIAPAEFRAQISALYLLFISLVGLFLGPPSVAMLTDYAFHDESMVRYSLLIVTVAIGIFGVAAVLLGRAFYNSSAREADTWYEQ